MSIGLILVLNVLAAVGLLALLSAAVLLPHRLPVDPRGVQPRARRASRRKRTRRASARKLAAEPARVGELGPLKLSRSGGRRSRTSSLAEPVSLNGPRP